MSHPFAAADLEPPCAPEPLFMEAFYAGEQNAMRRCYLEHFDCVEKSVGRILQGADKETVVHEVFLRLLSDADLRANFRGGSMRAWMARLARNCAVDYWRRRRREQPSGTAGDLLDEMAPGKSFEESIEAREAIQRFRETHLPERWRGVFEARFVRHLDQSEAARLLGMRRTTLAWQEFRVRQLLRRFLLGARSE